MSEQKPSGYWKSLDNILRECREVMQEHNFQTLPGGPTLKKLGRGDLAKGIDNNYSFLMVRQALGEENVTEKRESGFWKVKENILAQARKLMEELHVDSFPPINHLDKLGYSTLRIALWKYDGGMEQFEKDLGKPVHKFTESGYWKSRENLLREIDAFCKEHGYKTIPKSIDFIRLGRSDIVAALTKHHGGLCNVKKSLGIALTRRETGFWSNSKNAVQLIKKIQSDHNLKEIPSESELQKLGYASVASGIVGAYGGMRKFARDHMNSAQPVRGEWRDRQFTIKYAKEILAKEGWERLPCAQDLSQAGYSSLSAAITKYHDGFIKFRTYLGQESFKRPNGLWTQRSYVLEQAKEFLGKNPQHQTIPGSSVLAKLGYSSLAVAINKHGGPAAFREELQLPSIERRESGLLKDEQYMFTQAINIMQELQVTYLPTSTQLRQLGYHGFLDGIHTYHGGLKKFRLRFESATGTVRDQSLESVLREYVA